MDKAKAIKALGDKAYDLGYENEKTYRGCGQCVMAALQDAFNMRDDSLFKAMTGYAGGGATTGEGGCGAYVAGILFLSLLKGRERDNFADPERVRFQTFALARKLHDRFIAEFGCVTCRDIHIKMFGRPYYLPDADEMAKFDDAGGHTTVCTEVCGKGARWAADLVIEEGLIPDAKLEALLK